MSKAFLQQNECADVIRLDEDAGAIDRTVDVGLCRKVNDRIRAVAFEAVAHGRRITDVAMLEAVP